MRRYLGIAPKSQRADDGLAGKSGLLGEQFVPDFFDVVS
jgi:hypothetical protein